MTMTDEPSDIGAASRRSTTAGWPLPQSCRDPAADTVADTAVRNAEFTAFYEQEFARLVAFLMVQGAGHHAADIAQEAMAKAYRQWDVLDRPGAWVRLTAERRWWKLARRSRTEIPHDDLPESSGLLEGTYEQIENRHVFLALLADLTDLQRQVLAWSYDGYHPTEIAVALGKEPATVRSVLRDARKKVQAGHPRGEVTS
uniref:RNA polymerase sigma factor n=1 Tax=Actinoplanes sp. CA-151224 TaxID=3239904 RepID=UPI003F495251